MHPWIRSLAVALAALALCLPGLAGCSGNTAQDKKKDSSGTKDEKAEEKKGETATVSGKVTYKGQPVTSGTISFTQEMKRGDRAKIQPDGTYKATNVPIGEVKVAILPELGRQIPAGGGGGPPKDAKDGKDGKGAKDGKDAKDAKKPAAVAIPEKYSH